MNTEKKKRNAGSRIQKKRNAMQDQRLRLL